MKTTKIITATAIASAMTLCISTASLAHSDHDHSKLPLNWTFVKDTANKIQNRDANKSSSRYVGLSKFEQKKLKYYGIQHGNSFNSIVEDQPIQVTKTMGGIEIKQAHPMDVATKWRIPLREKASVSMASMGETRSHVGHDHRYLPYEWDFSRETMNKIQNRIDRMDTANFVGLNHFEQKLMNKYGIKAGYTFHTYINGVDVMLERTVSGVKVVDSVEQAKVAASGATANENKS